MAVLSRLLLATNCQKLSHINGLLQKLLPKNNSCTFQNQNGTRRWMSGHHVMELTPTRWQWKETKNWFHFYFLVGAIPATLIIAYANIFIGPATLEPIPEGYNPQVWEYHKHPITRFISRYIVSNPQMEYEKYLHKMHKVLTKRDLRYLQRQVKYNLSKNSDYKYWSYKRAPTKDIIDIRRRIDADDPTV